MIDAGAVVSTITQYPYYVSFFSTAEKLSLGGLITHRAPFSNAADAYATAFTDPTCLKMLLDWGVSR